MRIIWEKAWLFMVLIMVFALSCAMASNNAVPPPPPRCHIEIGLVGGLGKSQLNSLFLPLSTDDNHVDSFDRDGYAQDVVSVVGAVNADKTILIGHSFGTETVLRIAEKFPNLKLIILIDPVSYDPFWASEMTVPDGITVLYVFYRTDAFGPKTAQLKGNITKELSIRGGHNSIPHEAQLISMIQDWVEEVQ